jgi:hypothetical protein
MGGLGLARRWLGTIETPCNFKLFALLEPEADCASECIGGIEQAASSQTQQYQ